jgi:hypothetical protein
MNKQLLVLCHLIMAASLSVSAQQTSVVSQSTADLLQKKMIAGKNEAKPVSDDWLTKAQAYIEISSYYFNQSPERTDIFFTTNLLQKTGFIINKTGFTVSPVLTSNESGEKDIWKAGLQLLSINKGVNNLYQENLAQYSFNSNKENLSVSYNNFSIEYLNNKEGLRQNFIIYEKPLGDNNLDVVMEITGNLSPYVKDNV